MWTAGAMAGLQGQCPPTCGPCCPVNCGQAAINGCAGSCPNTDNGGPVCPAITPASGGTVTLSGGGTVTITWTAAAKAEGYQVQIYPQGTSCASPYAICPALPQAARTYTFFPNANGGSVYTFNVRPVNTTCGTDYGAWCASNFTIMSSITTNYFLDNAGAATSVGGICQLGGAPAVNPGGTLSVQGSISNYSSPISGTSTTLAVPYWPAPANNVVTVSPGEFAPGQTYTCTCPAGCQYSGIASPQTGVNFFFTSMDLTHSAWYQAVNGHIQALQTNGTALLDPIPITTCDADPICVSAMITKDLADTENSAGLAVTGGGSIDSSDEQGASTGYVTDRATQAFVTGTSAVARENYEYFYRLYSMGDSPGTSDDFAASGSDAVKPGGDPLGSKRAFFHEGDLTIQQAWSVPSGEKIVIFVHGNLILSDPSSVGNLIEVAPGGFLAFIVSGNITIDATVGNSTLTSLNSNVDGVYIADGTFTVASMGTAGGGDKRFIGEGTFVGWGGVDLNRDYSDGGARKAQNNNKPTETFVFRPDFVKNLPERMAKPIYVWQETN